MDKSSCKYASLRVHVYEHVSLSSARMHACMRTSVRARLLPGDCGDAAVIWALHTSSAAAAPIAPSTLIRSVVDSLPVLALTLSACAWVFWSQLPPREIQHHAREPNSETGSHASTRVGRADESRFTEALGAVHEMQALQAEAGMNSAGGADRLEAALLGKLEAEADGGRRALTRTLSELGGMSLDTAAASEVSAAPPRALPATESVRSEVSESACSVQNGFEPSFELAQAVQAAPATSSAAPSLLSAVAKRVSQHRSYERIDEADGARPDALTCLHWCSAGLAQLLWRELLLSATLLPLLAVLAAQSDLPKDMRVTLALPLCYSYAAARAIGVIVEAAASAVLRYRPVFEWTTLIVRG
eukprot:6181520-Pleurochrysis_carterae.AAC.1